MIPLTVNLLCPVDGCDWSTTVEGPDPRALSPDTLASVFGPGVFAASARARHQETIETTLTLHHATHQPKDYLGTIARLQRDLATALRS